jgi:Neurotransmitter-gated ion-channel ligand binding domain
VFKALFLGLGLLFATATAAPAEGQQKQEPAPTEAAPAPGPSAPVNPSATAKEPKPELERPTVWGEPTEVRVGIYVIDIDDVNSAEQNFSASVYLEARWDLPALRHKGPGPLHRAWTEVWTPRLVLVNQQQAWRAFPESVEITPSGEVIYRQKFWGKFSQDLDLHSFPEDQQNLTVQVAAAGLLESEVHMVPLTRGNRPESGIARSFSLPDFNVISWEAGPHAYAIAEGDVGTAGYQLDIIIRRRVTYYVVKMIIPLCLIIVMSWAPRWINPMEIGTNLGISATAFLTLTAYMFAINVVLPRVSYITRMDRFILLSTFMVFAGLVQTVLTTSFIKREKIALVMRIDFWSRAIYPVILLFVLSFSFWF